MGTQLATPAATPPATNLPTHPMAILASAIEAKVPASELTQLMDLAERYDENCAKSAFNAAVARFQSRCPVVVKNRQAKSSGKFEGYQYASYDDVMAVAKPHLDECGLSVAFSFDPTDKGIKTTCTISHGSYSKEYYSTVPIPSGLNVNDTQRYGACMRYAQRYALTGALNIVVSDEDNDAEDAYETISEAEHRALEQLLMETNSDFARFCKAYGIERTSELPKSQLAQARAQLNRKVQTSRGMT